MISRLLLFFCIFSSAFAAHVPKTVRIDIGLKMHRGFCLQSFGQSTAAATTFNDAYREGIAAGIPPRKLIAIGDLFMWYRKYGHYLRLFETSGRERITDEYWIYTKSELQRTQSEFDKRREAQEIAEIARDMIFAYGEMIGALLAVLYIPEFSAKIGAGALGYDGFTRFWNGFNRLKTKNDEIAKETKERLKKIQETASYEEEDWDY